MGSIKNMNSLEKALFAAKAGNLPMKVFAGTLLGSDLIIPSVTEINEDLSNFQPLIFQKNGFSFLAAFTDSERMLPFRHLATYFAEINGLKALSRMPKGYGLLINANTDGALEITPHGVEEMLLDFSGIK